MQCASDRMEAESRCVYCGSETTGGEQDVNIFEMANGTIRVLAISHPACSEAAKEG